MKYPKGRLCPKSILVIILLLSSICGYGQDARYKKVTLQAEKITLKEFFDAIHTQTGVDFIYNSADARYAEPITVDAKDKPLGLVLDMIFKNTDIEYTTEGNIITVRHRVQTKNEKNKEPVTATAQDISIYGIVRESSGEPLAGVAIWVKDTKIGTITDENGRYQLSIPPTTARPITLRYTCVGMETTELVYDGKSHIDVTLRASVNTLAESEIVATGMFVRKAESFTGAVSTFNQEQLKRMGNQNILSSLKNIDPSFVINESVDFGSDPNHMPDIQLRGQNNIPDLKGEYQTAPNQPLFILDGFEASIEKIYDLDMNLVESVTLLKDAAAKAIYGSKAANGVVVIETVKPEEGRLRVSYTGSLDLSVPDLTSYNLCNAAEKLQAEVFAGKYTSSNAYTQAELTEQYNELFKEVARGVNSYWMAEPLRVGVGQKHTLLLDGGDDAMRYSASLSYNDIAGVMKGSDRQTISGSITLSYRYRTLSFRNQLSIDGNKAKNSPYGDFSEYSRMNPYWRIYDENGLIKQYTISAYNPLYNAGLNSKDESRYTTFTENFYAEWEAVKNLRFRVRFGLTKQHSGSDVFIPASHTNYANISPSSAEYLQRGEYTQSNGDALTISSDISAAYALEINKHLLYANISYTIDEARNENVSNRVIGFPSDKMDYISFGNNYPTGGKPGGSENTTRSMGVVASANYSYDNRYLADVSYRLSGSSQFGAKERWGNFWAAGIGWNIHQEHFMENVRWINFWKLRASIGYTGSQNFNSYQAIATYQYITDKTYNGDMGVVLMGLANDHLKWQQQYDRNIGMDLSLFRKLSLRAEYYWATTTNLLTDISLAPSAGFATYKENMGETLNKGVELGVNYQVYQHSATRSFVNIFLNLAHNTNKISKISDALKEVNEQQDADKNVNDSSEEAKAKMRKPSTRFEEGQSLSAIWAVRSAGIDPVTGNEVFIKKDGTTTYEWSTDDQVVCGDTEPKINGNIGTSFSFQGLEMSLTFTYKLGGQTYNSTLVDKIENVDVNNWNVDRRVLYDRWNTPGVPAKFKAISDVSTTKPTSRFVEDYNELALSAITVGYDFSYLKFMRRCALQYFKLSFNMNDVCWLSTVKKEQGLSYPRAHAFAFSLQIRF